MTIDRDSLMKRLQAPSRPGEVGESTGMRSEAADYILELEGYIARMNTRVLPQLDHVLRDLIREQSEGEWDDKTIEKDVKVFSKKLRELFFDVKGEV